MNFINLIKCYTKMYALPLMLVGLILYCCPEPLEDQVWRATLYENYALIIGEGKESSFYVLISISEDVMIFEQGDSLITIPLIQGSVFTLTSVDFTIVDYEAYHSVILEYYEE